MKSDPLLHSHILSILTITVLVLTAAACEPATAVPGPDCLLEDLVAPVNLWPDHTGSPTDPGEIPVMDTLTPTLTWEFPAGCEPDGYTLELFQPHPEGEVTGMTMSLLDGTSWTPTTPLLHGAMYTWRVSAQLGTGTGPVSEEATFMTGPLCMDPYASEYPAPILLSPEDGTVITSSNVITFSDGTTTPTVSFYMIWDDPAECLPEEGYLLQISDSPSFSDDLSHTIVFNQDYQTYGLFFFPPGFAWSECTPYYWRVQANLPGSVEGPFSETRSFIINTQGVECSAIPTPVSSATPLAPLATIKLNARCRSGPTLDHPDMDFLPEGSSFPIMGRNQENTWWYIFNERIQNYCWVSGKLVEVQDVPPNLAVITPVAPPLPGPTDEPTEVPPIPVVGCLVKNLCIVPCPQGAFPGTVCTP